MTKMIALWNADDRIRPWHDSRTDRRIVKGDGQGAGHFSHQVGDVVLGGGELGSGQREMEVVDPVGREREFVALKRGEAQDSVAAHPIGLPHLEDELGGRMEDGQMALLIPDRIDRFGNDRGRPNRLMNSTEQLFGIRTRKFENYI